jgi:two-component system nitrogen regulation sensor histidine kinase GlnL
MTGKPVDPNAAKAPDLALAVLHAIQNPVILVDAGGLIAFANWEAESFFGASAGYLSRHDISSFIPFGSPLLTLIDQVRERKAPVSEYRVDLSSPRLGAEKLVDIYVAPVTTEPGSVVVVIQERTMADKIDRQLTHRGAARSVTGLASMLAHEIRSPAFAARHSSSKRPSSTRTGR